MTSNQTPGITLDEALNLKPRPGPSRQRWTPEQRPLVSNASERAAYRARAALFRMYPDDYRVIYQKFLDEELAARGLG